MNPGQTSCYPAVGGLSNLLFVTFSSQSAVFRRQKIPAARTLVKRPGMFRLSPLGCPSSRRSVPSLRIPRFPVPVKTFLFPVFPALAGSPGAGRSLLPTSSSIPQFPLRVNTFLETCFDDVSGWLSACGALFAPHSSKTLRSRLGSGFSRPFLFGGPVPRPGGALTDSQTRRRGGGSADFFAALS